MVKAVYHIYETELTLMPDRVVELIAKLDCALRETDFVQTVVHFKTSTGNFPSVQVAVRAPDELQNERG